jgi:hypothetical protein
MLAAVVAAKRGLDAPNRQQADPNNVLYIDLEKGGRIVIQVREQKASLFFRIFSTKQFVCARREGGERGRGPGPKSGRGRKSGQLSLHGLLVETTL